MQRVLILHGWGGSDYPHWQSLLASKIACSYGTVSFPLLRDEMTPKLNEWLEDLDREIKLFNPNVVVCHSLGNILWMHYVRQNSYQIDKLYMVAIPNPNKELEELKTFYPCPLPDSLNAKEITVVASTNDPFATIEQIEPIAKKYNAKFKILEDAGHINKESGYGEWEWIEKEFGVDKTCLGN